MVLSADPERDPSTLAIVGAGASLAISDIPFHHVLGGGARRAWWMASWSRIPTYEETKTSQVNIVVAGTEEGIVMVEAGAQQVSEADVLAAIEFGHDCCKKIAAGIRELMKKCGKTKKAYTTPEVNKALYDQIAASAHVELKDAMNTEKYEKLESYSRIDAAKKKAMEALPEEQKVEGKKLFDALKERIFRDEMLKDQAASGWPQVRSRSARSTSKSACCRALTGLRCSRVARRRRWLPRRSARKTTSSGLSCWTLRRSSKRFMLHYNFPPFSVGEVGFMRGAGRREIGHGALAERAIAAVVPDDKAFPYTMRVVSDILESNGSSSMASVCGATSVADGRGCADHRLRSRASPWAW